MATQLRYVIDFVSGMNEGVEFYRDTLGMSLRFQSPGWNELESGDTTIALHLASENHPAGRLQLGFRVPDIEL